MKTMKNMKISKLSIAFAAALAAVIVSLLFCTAVYADDEEAYFGSDEYSWDYEEEAAIGVYASSSEDIDSAVFTVTYDPDMLEYESGGELVEDGVIEIEVDSVGDTVCRSFLYFTPVTGGTTYITIESVEITDEDGNTVTVSPVETAVDISIPEDAVLSTLTVNGTEITDFDSDTTVYSLEVSYNITSVEVGAESDDAEIEIVNEELEVGENSIYIYAESDSGITRYTLYVVRHEASAVLTEETSEETESETETIIEAESESEEEEEETGFFAGLLQMGLNLFSNFPIIAILIIVLILFLIVDIIVVSIVHSKNKKRAALSEPQDDYAEADEELSYPAAKAKELPRAERKNVVIDVSHVTMQFKRDRDESSSVKELVIRMVKGKRQMVTFTALDDVSFHVEKGEVVGIIGTNGSGKSTILKIISGALKPTKGSVTCEAGKIQLLTLGTGFDHELTGRENVYLNGSIIGYSKEFIDEHFDEIVEFAELENFMDEKVKNYSSGMVSRLGFAIATAGTTPEILILDEVLSVGDQFFKEKSLRRIKEMIHGGSTVLIVSHSTGVIRQNCSKVVWIEKGRLMMVGDPAIVCRAYETMKRS